MQTVKELDTNGWLEIKGNPISKVGVFEYLGAQIDPRGEMLGIDPGSIYKVFRPEEELASAATIESFKLLPWIDEHVMLGDPAAGLTSPDAKGIKGVIGETVYYESGYLKANLKVFSEQLAALIKNGKKELSIGYYSEYDPIPGVYQGTRYDFVQRNLRGNHVALVDKGRSGEDVAVLDHLKKGVAVLDHFKLTIDGNTMSNKETDEVKTKDAEAASTEGATGATVAEASKQLEELLPLINVIKQMATAFSAQQATPVDEETESYEGDMNLDAEAPVADKDAAPPAMDKKLKAAMDSALKKIGTLESKVTQLETTGVKSLMAHINDRNQLAEQLSRLEQVGTFDHADKTLDEVAAYGVSKLGLACKKGEEITALRAFMAGRKDSPQLFAVTDSAASVQNEQLAEIIKGGLD